jgi:tight adherence protein B
LSLLTFGAVAMAVAGVYSILSDLYLRDLTRVNQRVDDEFRRKQRERAKRSLLPKDLSQIASEAGVIDESVPVLRQRLQAMVEQSGLDLTPQRLQALMIVSGLGLGLVVGLLRQSPLTGAVGAVVGAVAPLLYVQYKRNARLEKLRAQLPDAFDLMGRIIRAGQTISQALLAVSDEFPQPVSGEFAYCYEQQNLGLSSETAFRDLSRRTGLLEVKIFVLALLVQQQTGGNLAELLDKLAAIIRDRYRIRGKIKAVTAEGRMQGAVLLALPPAMFVIMLLLNHNYASILLEHRGLLLVTLVSEAFGALWIQRIVHFDF